MFTVCTTSGDLVDYYTVMNYGTNICRLFYAESSVEKWTQRYGLTFPHAMCTRTDKNFEQCLIMCLPDHPKLVCELVVSNTYSNM